MENELNAPDATGNTEVKNEEGQENRDITVLRAFNERRAFEAAQSGDTAWLASVEAAKKYAIRNANGGFDAELDPAMPKEQQLALCDLITEGLTGGRVKNSSVFTSQFFGGKPTELDENGNEVKFDSENPSERLRRIRQVYGDIAADKETDFCFTSGAAMRDAGLPQSRRAIEEMTLQERIDAAKRIDNWEKSTLRNALSMTPIDNAIRHRADDRYGEDGNVKWKDDPDTLKLIYDKFESSPYFEKFRKVAGYGKNSAGLARWLYDNHRVLSMFDNATESSPTIEDSLSPDFRNFRDEYNRGVDADEYLIGVRVGGHYELRYASGGKTEAYLRGANESIENVTHLNSMIQARELRKQIAANPDCIKYLNSAFEQIDANVSESRRQNPHGSVTGMIDEFFANKVNPTPIVDEMVKDYVAAKESGDPEKVAKTMAAIKTASDAFVQMDNRVGNMTGSFGGETRNLIVEKLTNLPQMLSRILDKSPERIANDAILKCGHQASFEESMFFSQVAAKIQSGAEPSVFSGGSETREAASLMTDLVMFGGYMKGSNLLMQEVLKGVAGGAARVRVAAAIANRVGQAEKLLPVEKYASEIAAIMRGSRTAQTVLDGAFTVEETALKKATATFLKNLPVGSVLYNNSEKEGYVNYLSTADHTLTADEQAQVKNWARGRSAAETAMMCGLITHFCGNAGKAISFAKKNEPFFVACRKMWTRKDIDLVTKADKFRLIIGSEFSNILKSVPHDFAFGYMMNAVPSAIDRKVAADITTPVPNPTLYDYLGSISEDSAIAGAKMTLQMRLANAMRIVVGMVDKKIDKNIRKMRKAAVESRGKDLHYALVHDTKLSDDAANEILIDITSKLRNYQLEGNEKGADELIEKVYRTHGKEVGDRLNELAYEFNYYQKNGTNRSIEASEIGVNAEMLGKVKAGNAKIIQTIFERAGWDGATVTTDKDGGYTFTIPKGTAGLAKDLQVRIVQGKITNRSEDGKFVKGWASDVVTQAEEWIASKGQYGDASGEFANALDAMLKDEKVPEAERQDKRNRLMSGENVDGLLDLADKYSKARGFFDPDAGTIAADAELARVEDYMHEGIHAVLRKVTAAMSPKMQEFYRRRYGINDLTKHEQDWEEGFVNEIIELYKLDKAKERVAGKRAELASFMKGMIGLNSGEGEGRDDSRRGYTAKKYSTSSLFTGSSADYDKPSLLKVGTGEGSQVYGWGLYASNRRGVAEGYANSERIKTTNKNANKIYAEVDKILRKEVKGQQQIDDIYKALGTTERWDDVKTNLIEGSFDEGSFDIFIKHEKELKKIHDELTAHRNLYEQTFFTNRAPGDESHLLKWYEQTSADNLKRFEEQAKKEGLVIPLEFWQGAYDPSGKDVYNEAVALTGSPQAASEFLARADIDGIKYPVDSYGGKTVKDGDKAGWNYVSFRDDNIRIDHKWADGKQLYSTSSGGNAFNGNFAKNAELMARMEDEVKKAGGVVGPEHAETGKPALVYGFHGTSDAMFTKFDPSKGDDKISVFTAGSKRTAQSYIGRLPSGSLVESSYKGKVDKAELERKLLKAFDEIVYKGKEPYDIVDENGNVIVSKDKLTDDVLRNADLLYYETDAEYTMTESIERQIFDTAMWDNRSPGAGLSLEEAVSKICEHWGFSGFDEFNRFEINKKDKTVFDRKTNTTRGYEDFVKWYNNGTIPDEELLSGVRPTAGIYNLAVKFDNPLVIDAKGSLWNNIKHDVEYTEDEYREAYRNFIATSAASVEELKQNLDYEGASRIEKYANMTYDEWRKFAGKMLHLNGKTTREIAERAKRDGHDGVIIRNVIDDGGRAGYETSADDIFISFDGKKIKMIDEFTYDDLGNPIPTSARGDWSNPDARYNTAGIRQLYQWNPKAAEGANLVIKKAVEAIAGPVASFDKNFSELRAMTKREALNYLLSIGDNGKVKLDNGAEVQVRVSPNDGQTRVFYDGSKPVLPRDIKRRVNEDGSPEYTLRDFFPNADKFLSQGTLLDTPVKIGGEGDLSKAGGMFAASPKMDTSGFAKKSVGLAYAKTGIDGRPVGLDLIVIDRKRLAESRNETILKDLSEAVMGIIARDSGWERKVSGDQRSYVHSISSKGRAGMSNYDLVIPPEADKWFETTLGKVVSKSITNFVKDFNIQRKGQHRGLDDIDVERALDLAHKEVSDLFSGVNLTRMFAGERESEIGAKTMGKGAADSASIYDRMSKGVEDMLVIRGWGALMSSEEHAKRIEKLFTKHLSSRIEKALTEIDKAHGKRSAIAPIEDYFADEFANNIFESHVRAVMNGANITTRNYTNAKIAEASQREREQRAEVRKAEEAAGIAKKEWAQFRGKALAEAKKIYAESKAELLKALHSGVGEQELKDILTRTNDKVLEKVKELGFGYDEFADLIGDIGNILRPTAGSKLSTSSDKSYDFTGKSKYELRKALESAYNQLNRLRAIRRARGFTSDELQQMLGFDSFERLRTIDLTGKDIKNNSDALVNKMVSTFITEYRKSNQSAGSMPLKDMMKDPVHAKELAETVAAWMKAAASKFSYGATRQSIRTMANHIESLIRPNWDKTVEYLRDAVDTLSALRQKEDVRTMIEGAVKEIDRGAMGRLKVENKSEVFKRNVFPRIQEYYKEVKRALTMTQEAVDKELASLNAEYGFDFSGDTGKGSEGVELSSSEIVAKRDAAMLKALALRRYGAAVEKSIGEAHDIVSAITSDIAFRAKQLEDIAAPEAELRDKAKKSIVSELKDYRIEKFGGNYEAEGRQLKNGLYYFCEADLFAKLMRPFHMESETYKFFDDVRRRMSIGHIEAEKMISDFSNDFIEKVDLLFKDHPNERLRHNFSNFIEEMLLPREELDIFSRKDWCIPKDGNGPFEEVKVGTKKIKDDTGKETEVDVTKKVYKAVPPSDALHDDPTATKSRNPLSLAQLMNIYASVIQPDMAEYRVAWGFTPDVIRRMEAALDANDMHGTEIAKILRNGYDAMRIRMNPVSERLVGMDILSPSELYSPLHFEGDYDPFSRQYRFTLDTYPTFLKPRKHTYRNRLNESIDSLRVYFDRIGQAANYIGFAETASRVKEVMDDSQVKKSFEKSLGRYATRNVYEQIQDAFNGGRMNRDGFLSELIRITNATTLFGRVPTSAKQLSGFGMWGAMGGMGWWFRSLPKLFRSGERMAQAMRENGNIFDLRQQEGFSVYSAEIAQAKNDAERRSATKKAIQWYEKHGMDATSFFDRVAGSTLAGAYFNEQYAKFLKVGWAKEQAKPEAERRALAEIEAEARKNALAETDYALQTSQQSSRQEFRHSFQRGNAAERAFSQFAGPKFLQFGLELNAINRYRMEKKAFDLDPTNEAKRRNYIAARNGLVSKLVAMHFVTPFALNVVNALFGAVFHKPEDREWSRRIVRDWLTSTVLGPLGNMWLFGSLAKQGFGLMTGVAVGDPTSLSKDTGDEVPFLKKTANIATDVGGLVSSIVGSALPGMDGSRFRREVFNNAMDVIDDFFPIVGDAVNAVGNAVPSVGFKVKRMRKNTTVRRMLKKH